MKKVWKHYINLKKKNKQFDVWTKTTIYVFGKSLYCSKKDFGQDVISIYKRSSNILLSEKQNSSDIIGSADPGLFKNDFEKNLYKRIHNIRKYFSSIGKSENYEESLKTLSLAKNEINEFFDNVVVNDNDPIIKKNRLELLKMLCKASKTILIFQK